jgi:hypothetical protein
MLLVFCSCFADDLVSAEWPQLHINHGSCTQTMVATHAVVCILLNGTWSAVVSTAAPGPKSDVLHL